MATFPLLILKLRGNIPLVPLIFAIYGHYSDITGPELRPRLMILWPISLTYIEFMTWWLILDSILFQEVMSECQKYFYRAWRVWLTWNIMHMQKIHDISKKMTSGWYFLKRGNGGKRRFHELIRRHGSLTTALDESIVCPTDTDVRGPLLENNEKEGFG